MKTMVALLAVVAAAMCCAAADTRPTGSVRERPEMREQPKDFAAWCRENERERALRAERAAQERRGVADAYAVRPQDPARSAPTVGASGVPAWGTAAPVARGESLAENEARRREAREAEAREWERLRPVREQAKADFRAGRITATEALRRMRGE